MLIDMHKCNLFCFISTEYFVMIVDIPFGTHRHIKIAQIDKYAKMSQR